MLIDQERNRYIANINSIVSMAPRKSKVTLSRDEQISIVRESIKEAPSTTKVKAWTFQIEKKFYVIISYFMAGNQMAVYPSNRKGVKTSTEPIISPFHSRDETNYLPAFERAIEKLFPSELIDHSA